MLKNLAILFSFLWAFLLASIWSNFTNKNCVENKDIIENTNYEKSNLNIESVAPDSIFIVTDSTTVLDKNSSFPEKENFTIKDTVVSSEIEKILKTPVEVKFSNNSSYFDDSNDLKNYLNLAKDFLLKNPKEKLLITGHSDSDGASKQNKRFSISRAIRMRDKLVNDGFKKSQLEILGKGESEPLVPNDSEKNKALNRRVSINLK